MTSPQSTAAPATAGRASSVALLLAALSFSPLYGQTMDVKPPPAPNPEKGWHDMSPMSDAELAWRRAGRTAPRAHAIGTPPAALGALPRVFFDGGDDGPIWVRGNTYKASFGPDGFTYVPFFGSSAPQNYPVQFVLRSVRIGGQELPLAKAAPSRHGQRVTLARGPVVEHYDVALEQVAQTFVIDSALAGDVLLELQVLTELQEDALRPGLQFGNNLGCVHYGDAHVVDGANLLPVATTRVGDTLRIHVPADRRGPGALVIDPIIQTTAFSATHANNASQPDIAYDAGSDTYLLVWQHPYSATDMDVWSEFRDGNGAPIPNTLDTVDFTNLSHTNPRVANLAAFDRFLVVTQRYDGTRWQIYGRLRLVGQFAHPIVFAISEPGFSGQCINPDIGGDPSETASSPRWLVVWQREFSATDFDIHARVVAGDTSMPAATIMIENSGGTIYSLPSVSQSNGNGLHGSPRWLVAYQFRVSATDEDIYGCAISPGGGIVTTNAPLDLAAAQDLYPSVSTPATDLGGSVPKFMVTYERQNPLEARARIISPLFSGSFLNEISPLSLGTFGLGPFWVHCESDGCRFAVTTGAATIGVATFALSNGALVLNEAPQSLPGIPEYPRLASKRSGGGVRTDYGVAYVEVSTAPDRIGVSAYHGSAGANTITRRVMACQGLNLDVTGRAFLGEALTFSLSNFGSAIPVFAFSNPAPATTLVCSQCPVGVSINTVTLIVGSSLPITIPCDPNLVGFAGAVQGLAVGTGPCVAQIHFSDTIDFTIR